MNRKTHKLSYAISESEFRIFEKFRISRGAATQSEILRMAVKQYMGKFTEKEKQNKVIENIKNRLYGLEKRVKVL